MGYFTSPSSNVWMATDYSISAVFNLCRLSRIRVFQIIYLVHILTEGKISIFNIILVRSVKIAKVDTCPGTSKLS